MDAAGYGSFEEIDNITFVGEKLEKPIGGLFVFYGHKEKSFRFMVAIDFSDTKVPET